MNSGMIQKMRNDLCEVRTWRPASGTSERKSTGGTGKETDSDRRINTEV